MPAPLTFHRNFALEIIIAATARQWKIFSLAYWHYKGAGPCSDDMRWPPCEVSWCKAVDGRRRGSHRHHSGYPVLRPLWLNPKPAVGAGNPTKVQAAWLHRYVQYFNDTFVIHIWYNKYNWNEELKIADEAARVYYENTVFEVVSLELKSQTENEISFSVCVIKGGFAQEPDRTIFLEFVNGHWKVVNEGYWYDCHILREYCKNAVTDFRRASFPPIGSVWSLWLVCTGEPLENKRKGDNFSGSVQNRRTSS